MPSAFPGRVIASSAQIAPGIILNSDINASAAIVDTKLAQITTALKVSGAALTSLASIPAGAGLIPTANLPAGSVTIGFTTNGGTQTISHGLGKIPSVIKFTAHGRDNGGQQGSSYGMVLLDSAGNITATAVVYGNWTSTTAGADATAGHVVQLGSNLSLVVSTITSTQFTLTLTGGANVQGIVWECN